MKQIFQMFCVLFTIMFANDTQQQIITTTHNTPKIILITIDGVRALDVFDKHSGVGNLKPTSRELMPTIYHRFVDNGIAIGNKSPAFAENPAHISLPGYIEIMSGHPSTICFNNYCKQNTKPTLINQFAGNSAVISGWETIARVFDTSLAATNINRKIRSKQWRDLKLPDNTTYPDEFGDTGYRSDKYTQEAATTYLKVKQPDFMWISYGDTDEWAHQNNMLQYWISLNHADGFVAEIMKLADPNTVFIICPDHGRSNNFRDHGWDAASGRVWIMIGGAGIPKAGFVSYDRDVHLSDIYPTVISLAKHINSERSLLNYKE